MKVSTRGRTVGRIIPSSQLKKYSSFSSFSPFLFTNKSKKNPHFNLFVLPFSYSSLPSPLSPFSSTLFAPSSLLHSKRNYNTKKEGEEMIENKETAAILIIAEEILNGSISDKNIPYLTKHLFSRGIKIRKIEVVTDNVKEIVEAINRLREEVKYIFTTGGIGPTHDDITYEALAAAYDCPVLLHDETKNKLAEVLKVKGSPLTPGRLRMCTLPSPPPPFHSSIHSSGPLTTTVLSPFNNDQNDNNNNNNKVNKDRRRVIKYHQHESLWVPLVEIESQTFIFPGVPSIFQNMLNLFDPIIPKNDTKTHKINVYTKHLEGDIAAALYEAETLFSPDLSIGSYPHYRPVSPDHSTHNKNVIQGSVTSDKDKIECVQIRICIQSPDVNKIEKVIEFLKSKINDCQDRSFIPDDSLPSKL